MKIYPIIRDVCCVLGLALLGSWQVGALAVAAPVDAEPRLELTSLVREVVENNPDIRAAQQRWMAAKAVIPQVRTLPDPWSTRLPACGGARIDVWLQPGDSPRQAPVTG